ncbi:SDR family oxidoreductase [Streptomyces sp. RTd22]|uniref:SDR family oxidoreductase n=1 Tax=Streptomyces sp. RTd22 TaxID=1841249 RepID=UPI000D1B7492
MPQPLGEFLRPETVCALGGARITVGSQGLPLGKIGQAHDLGAPACFLAREQAAFATGTVLLADGGSSRGVG